MNIKLPARASIWYLGASGTAKAVGFLVTPFFTRMISEKTYGELTLYLTLVGAASVSCSGVTSGSAVYKGIKLNEDDRGSFLKSALLVSLLVSITFCILLFAFSRFIAIKSHLFIPLFIQIICDGIVAISTSSAKYSYRYKEVALIILASSVLPTVITLALLKAVNGKFRVRIYSLLAISVCLSIYSIIKIFNDKGRVNKKLCSLHLKTSLPLMPHSISSALSGQADKLIITHYMGAAALAKYAVVHSLGVGLQFAVGAVGFALGPWIIRRLDKKEYNEVSGLVGLLLSAFSALSLFVVALAPEAMRILAPREYLDAFPALLPIAISTPLTLLSSVITVCLVHFGKGKGTATSSVAGALFGLLLNFTLIPKLGYLGAGLSLFASQLISVVVGLYALLQTIPEKTISSPHVIKNLVLTGTVGLVFFFLFNSLALRVFLLIIPAIMLLNVFYGLKGLIVE